ncbi:MAG: aminoglycoside phosphotransferase family protein [Oscillospiraceae bacterium]|jgi:hypothetical protein|nr:aminoglycoside phosphotransferase family protein [Oscillospiraceae bacterium]
MENLSGILRQFALEEEYNGFSAPKTLEDGHINDTYVFASQREGGEPGPRYLLQRINTFVFKHPRELMENILHVTEHIRSGAAAQASGLRTLSVYRTKTGELCYTDEEGGTWRCYNYVENTYSLQAASCLEDAYRAARAFGAFARMIADFPIGQLHETIPDFHHTVRRYEQLEQAIAENRAGRLEEVRAEVAFAQARRADAARLVDLLAAGKLPLRVTHNDTKLNNVLFDLDTHEPVCVVDLDTIMPGLSLYDFGDSIRFLGNTAAEDERDLTKVDISLPIYESYARGYLAEAGESLWEEEARLLPFSAKLMSYECGMRFLADYLNGDVYFRVHQADDNLARCRTQFKLVEKIEARLDEMEAVTMGIYRGEK